MKSNVRSRLLTAAAIAAVPFFGGCGESSLGIVPVDFEVSLERGPCFGACPVYSLTVSADGSVSYDGIRFVLAEGRLKASVAPEEVIQLYRAVVNADFFGLEDRYEVPWTDLPSITTTVTLEGRKKSVYHYGLGCGTDLDPAPAGLCRVEGLLEAIPVSNGWISSP